MEPVPLPTVRVGVATRVPVPIVKEALPEPGARVIFPLTLSELVAPSCLRSTVEDPVAPPMVRLPATAAVADIRTSVPLLDKTSWALVGTVPKLQLELADHWLLVAPVKELFWAWAERRRAVLRKRLRSKWVFMVRVRRFYL
jgi:hypothetical protein